MRRQFALMVSVVMFALIAVPASASEEAPTRDAPTASDVRSDRPVDAVRDHPTDRVSDRVTDRYRCREVVTDRRCLDDRHPHDVNVRALIHRLINAGEWEKLFRLLHRLGVI